MITCTLKLICETSIIFTYDKPKCCALIFNLLTELFINQQLVLGQEGIHVEDMSNCISMAEQTCVDRDSRQGHRCQVWRHGPAAYHHQVRQGQVQDLQDHLSLHRCTHPCEDSGG